MLALLRPAGVTKNGPGKKVGKQDAEWVESHPTAQAPITEAGCFHMKHSHEALA